MKHLQIEIDGDVDKNKPGYEIKVTPVDIALSDEAAAHFEKLIATGDLTDAEPGDGEFDVKQHIRVPVKINLFIAHLNTTVDIDAKVTMRIKPTV